MIPFLLAHIFGMSIAHSGDRGKENGKTSPNETNLVGTYLSPCLPSDPENIFLRLLRVNLSNPQKLLEAFAVYKIFIESAIDVQYCGHCQMCFFGAHKHVIGNETNNPLNVINPYTFVPLDHTISNSIKSTLNLHYCDTLKDYINLIKNDFLEGIAVGKSIQEQYSLVSEKEVFNALSHRHWYMVSSEFF